MSDTYYINFKNNHPVSDKIFCECGGHYSYFSKSRHSRTKKHLHFINTGEKWKGSTNAERIRKCRAKMKALASVGCH